MKHSLAFKDPSLEKQFQNDKGIAKPLIFHKYLILEFALAACIIFINYFTGISKSLSIMIVWVVCLLCAIALIAFLLKRFSKFQYMINLFVLIHIGSLMSFIAIETTRGREFSPNYYLFLTIISAAVHLHFVSIVISRIKWYWAAFWDLVYHIFYICVAFPFSDLKNNPLIVMVHLFCFVSFLMLSYDQEKSLREIYKIITDSKEHLNEFKMLIKNVIPFPTLILDLDNKNIEFINNFAVNLVKNDISETPFIIDSREDNNLFNFNIHKENKLNFSELEIFLKKCELIKTENTSIKIKMIKSLSNNENSFYEILRQLNNDSKIFKLFQESLDFHQITVRFRNNNKNMPTTLENLNPEKNVTIDSFFVIKFLKIFWNKKQSILLIINDVTDINKIKQLQTLDVYKNQLLATVSHDLRTPLNGMIGLIGMVLPNIAEKKDRKNLNIALKSGNLLAHMINDILDFSQISNQKLRLVQEKLDLMKLIKETVKVIKFQILAKGLKFILDCKMNKAEIISDYCRLKQILLNLLTNAIKFTPTGYIRLSLDLYNTNYRIMVEDTGIGIKEEDQPKLFHLFGKLDSTELNKTGIGLGLTISNNLVKLLNPEDQNGIHLESQWSKGSKFWFLLKPNVFQNPSETVSPSKIQTSINSPINLFNSLKNKRILIADDDLVNIMVAEMYCKYYNMDYKSVTNGKEAVDFIDHEVISNDKCIDAILMDCNMPILNGFQATIEILDTLNKHQKNQIPIIGVTANVLQEDLDKCLKVGMKNYLIKPINREDFGNCLKKILC